MKYRFSPQGIQTHDHHRAVFNALSINVWFYWNFTVSSRFSVPEIIDGNTLTATVVDLNAWVEYEFRVLAKNSVGVGEPSPVSVRTRTEDAGAREQTGCR